MLKDFSVHLFSLLGPCATLSFDTPLLAEKYDVFSYILNDSFMVSTLVVESNIDTHVQLVKLYMFYLDVISGMDKLPQ